LAKVGWLNETKSEEVLVCKRHES